MPQGDRMAENKTKANAGKVEAYLAAIPDETRRKDCAVLADLMARAAGFPPVMWGTGIVGFGTHHYRYESGREGETCRVGFSSRKGEIALYGLNAAPDHAVLVARLGKHKAGKGCLYLKGLEGVDLEILEQLVGQAASAKAS